MVERPFLHLPPPASDPRERRILDAMRGTKRGKLECVVDVTLSTGVTSTTITDHRISTQTAFLFDPVTANAAVMLAAGTIYVLAANRTKSQAIISHPISALTDLTFKICLIG